MASLDGALWKYNLVKVVIVDVTDDYRLMQPPMPSEFYPVLEERWLPSHGLAESLPHDDLLAGYLYDWHESPIGASDEWYVGVVREDLARALEAQAMLGQ